ncbi:MAG: hypothetical protein SPF74_05580 [Candidatus Limivicinus sp.]|nr:hypothetical protein [Candidatus Limivicinus sp.]
MQLAISSTGGFGAAFSLPIVNAYFCTLTKRFGIATHRLGSISLVFLRRLAGCGGFLRLDSRLRLSLLLLLSGYFRLGSILLRELLYGPNGWCCLMGIIGKGGGHTEREHQSQHQTEA